MGKKNRSFDIGCIVKWYVILINIGFERVNAKFLRSLDKDALKCVFSVYVAKMTMNA